MRYLLDTCILSDLLKRKPHRAVASWISQTDEELLAVSVLTLGELHKGVAKLKDGSKRRRLSGWVEHDLPERFRGRILPVTEAVARKWGETAGKSELEGISLPVIDALIAATALVHGLVVVTLNAKDFERCGAEVFDPSG